jgi:hypothetical protein
LSHFRRVRSGSLIVWGIACGVVCLLLLGGYQVGLAQTDDELWSQPVNLSRSGAAESPLLLAGPDRQLQLFWWDRFDGLTTAFMLDGAWSDPVVAPIQLSNVVGTGAGARVVVSTLPAMPDIVRTGETALALWSGEADPDTGLRPLLSSRLSLGAAEWTAPEALAESALTWATTADAPDGLHLVYCQTQQSAAFPAGIYHVRSTDGGITWSEPVTLYTSLYARLWTEKSVRLSLSADASGNVLVGWNNPRRDSASYVFSHDGGATWSAPAPVQDGETVGLHPHFYGFAGFGERRGTRRICGVVGARRHRFHVCSAATTFAGWRADLVGCNAGFRRLTRVPGGNHPRVYIVRTVAPHP